MECQLSARTRHVELLAWLPARALQVNFAGLLVAAERLVGHGACAARVLRAAEDGGEVLEHDSLARRGAAVCQRAPSEAGFADGLDNVDDEVTDAEGHVLDVRDVEDALKVCLVGKSKGKIFALKIIAAFFIHTCRRFESCYFGIFPG